MRRIGRVVFAGLLLTACGGPHGSGEHPPLTVFAAASTADVVTRLAADFEGGHVRTSFGPSSSLARQVADGAPADVYVSANASWVDYLRQAGALDGDAVVFAQNALVCVAPGDSALEAPDVGTLVSRLAGADKVAIADAGVPAGDYARQSLVATGDLPRLKPWLVGQDDVRAVLRAVERGECAAGFVYATDARVGQVRTLFRLPASSHAPIEYHAAVVKGGANIEEARRFLAYLVGGRARAVLVEAGFLPPE